MSGAIIGGALGAGGSIASGLLGSSAAKSAAQTQASAAEQAAQLQAELGQESLGYQADQYGNSLALEQPWLQGGANSLSTLQYLMGLGPSGGQQGSGLTTGSTSLSIPGVNGSVSVPTVKGLQGTANTKLGAFGSLMSPYSGGQFQAPTLQQAQQTPGYQFALQQGENAMQASAAANGNLLTGGTETALNNYAQNMANTNYNNVYNQALQTYNTNYNTWANQKAQNYNMLAGQAGLGQTTAQQLSNAGMQSANSISNILGNTGAQIGQGVNNAAAATASGYLNSANAWNGAIGGATGSLSQMAMLNQFLQNQGNQGSIGNNINGELLNSIIPYQGLDESTALGSVAPSALSL